MKTTKLPFILAPLALVVEYVAIIATNQAPPDMVAQDGGYNHTPYALMAKVLAVLGVAIAVAVVGLSRGRPIKIMLSVLLVLLCALAAVFAWRVSSAWW